jgi:hypothetical protein
MLASDAQAIGRLGDGELLHVTQQDRDQQPCGFS